MNCALWLNRRKIYSAAEIKDNLDIASLLGYFSAGSLIEWLETHGGESCAKKLSSLSPNDPKICEKMAKIFGGKPSEFKKLGLENGGFSNDVCYCGTSYKSGSFGRGSFRRGSFRRGSFNAGSFALSSFFGSFNKTSGGFYNYIGSFYLGSFLFGSGFYEWEWEWEWEKYFGSFYRGSFYLGSGFSARLAFLRKFGSFRFGSFNFGSFNFGSFANGGSFNIKNPVDFSKLLNSLDEYDRIMLESVFGCPLNQFGYGIHNI